MDSGPASRDGLERSVDPHWELTLAIAGKLWLYGEYVAEIDASTTQRLVDLQWAAHQAGRLVGVAAHVEVSPRFGEPPTARVTVTFVDPDGAALVRAQDGLDALLRSVLAARSTRLSGRRNRIAAPRSPRHDDVGPEAE